MGSSSLLKPAALVALLALVALAGCLGSGAESGPARDGAAQAGASGMGHDTMGHLSLPTAGTPVAIDTQDCVEAGAHSNYNLVSSDFLPKPWVPADIADQVGDQTLSSEGPPRDGKQWGIYHGTVVCQSFRSDSGSVRARVDNAADATVDGVADASALLPASGGTFTFGFVGIRVEPPPFDDAPRPASVQYLCIFVGSDDPQVNAALAAAGFPAMPVEATLTQAAGVYDVVMAAEGHGRFESLLKAKELGPMAQRMRLWLTPSTSGGHAGHDAGPAPYRPIALDLENLGGTHSVADGRAVIAHTDTQDHAPLPGAGGHGGAIVYTGFDRAIRSGVQPDVRLDEAWGHMMGLV